VPGKADSKPVRGKVRLNEDMQFLWYGLEDLPAVNDFRVVFSGYANGGHNPSLTRKGRKLPGKTVAEVALTRQRFFRNFQGVRSRFTISGPQRA